MDLFVVLVLAKTNTKTFLSLFFFTSEKTFKNVCFFLKKLQKKKMTIQKKNGIIKKNGDMAEW
jgi:hypothetical protein